MRETKYLRIHGKVQGVSYRAWAAEQAKIFRLDGWVRNRRDKTVEATVTGIDDDIQKFVSACYKGPSSAKVTIIEVKDGVDEELDGFKIRDTL